MSSATIGKDPEAESENPFPESAKFKIFIYFHATKGNEEAMEVESKGYTAECRVTCYTDSKNVKEIGNLMIITFLAEKACPYKG